MSLAVTTKQWGNSVGVIIPKEVVDTLHIKPGEELIMNIEKKQNVLKELFGALPFKEPTEKILRETRKEMEGRWL